MVVAAPVGEGTINDRLTAIGEGSAINSVTITSASGGTLMAVAVRPGDQVAAKHEELARHDQSDYVGLGALTEQLRTLEAEIADVETRWLELSEELEA